jgi:TRAP-type C4-dicarboxylate transport system substrate-binding protein
VRLKWTFGAIAGDDMEAADRIARGQLDGVASGPWLCERWAPSFRALRLPGIFDSRAESTFAAHTLKPVLDEEFARAGWTNLGESSLGAAMFFLRTPVHSIDELRRVPMWAIDKDPTGTALLKAMGLHTVELPFSAASEAYDAHKLDGFITPPSAALAFQWSVQARYVLPLRMEYLMGCMVVKSLVWAKIAYADQQEVQDATARFVIRFDDVGDTADTQLISGLFERQGLKTLPVSESLRQEWREAGRAAREQLVGHLVPRPLVERLMAALADYRLEHAR